MKYLKSVAFSFLALILGLVGLSFVISDPGPGESMAIRILTAALFFFLSGAAIAFFNPTLWVISGLTAWGGVLMGGLITLSAVRRYGGDAFNAQEPPYISSGLIMLLLPITFSLIGGYVGKLFSQRRIKTHKPSRNRS